MPSEEEYSQVLLTQRTVLFEGLEAAEEYHQSGISITEASDGRVRNGKTGENG